MNRALLLLLCVCMVGGVAYLLFADPAASEMGAARQESSLRAVSTGDEGQPGGLGAAPETRKAVTGRAAEKSNSLPATTTPEEEDLWMPGAIELDVRDALTGDRLEAFRVQVAKQSLVFQSGPGVGADGTESLAGRAEFRWPRTGGSHRVRDVYVYAEGYARSAVAVNIVRGGRYEALMEPACTLIVAVDSAWQRRVAVAVLHSESEDFGIHRTLEPSGSFETKWLPPGRVVVTMLDVTTGAVAAAEAVLRPMTPATVTLAPNPAFASAPLRVIVDFPAGERPEGDIEVGLKVRSARRTLSRKLQVELDGAEAMVSGGRERHVVEFEGIGFGVGVAWATELLVEQPFVHTAQHPAVIELRVPDPVEFEVQVVDAVTGERTPHTVGDVVVGVGSAIRGLRDIEAVTPGRFLVTARGHRIYVSVPSAHGYIESYAQASPRPGEIVTIYAEPIPSLLIGLCEAGVGGAPIPWPVGSPPVLTRGEDQPEATYRFEYEDDAVRLWVTGGSFWTLHVPDVPGYRGGQTHTLWFGEDTELEMVRYGVER